MQQFTVPQFIDVEDKIIGPITVRQFILMLVAGFFLFLEYKLSDLALFLVLGIPTALIFAVIAFVKINAMPFHYFLLNFVQTMKRPHLRLWAKFFEGHNPTASTNKSFSFFKTTTSVMTPETTLARKTPASQSRLSQLSLVVDTGGIYNNLTASDDLAEFKQ